MSNNNKLSSLPISKLIPNIVTLTGLCLGLFAIRYAMLERWELAVILVVIASFLDGIDGGIARLLDAQSEFGAQLDSLADFVNFNVVPALIMYMWITHEIKGLGWAASIFFIICGAIRLARFNVSQSDDSIDPELKDKFFVGMPVPSAACLALLPLILTFLFDDELGYQPFTITPLMVIICMLVISLFMVSRIPTMSLKKVKIPKELQSLVLACAGLFIISLATKPWITLPVLGIVYLSTIPYCVVSYLRSKK